MAARMPTDEQARLLRQPATRPLLCVESVDADLADVPVKFGETLFCGDRVQLCVRMAEVAG
ncbi:MAG TPA: UTRA domain-containing protein [Ramlibacter sp.]